MAFFTQNKIIGQLINDFAQSSGLSTNLVLGILVVILIWSGVWKLLGMWKSARKSSWIWFIVLAITNTVGILPILYIYFFSKINWNKFIQVEVKKNPKKKSKKVVRKKK